MATVVEKNISVIPAIPTYDRMVYPQMKAFRVATYCRVSTLTEQQESSYGAQVGYYAEKIKSNPNWKLTGTYADDGKGATSTGKRVDFQAMIDDCMAGRINIVITESIGRLARNTVDPLIHTRKPEEKDIVVYSEKEGINTLEGSGELLITILGSQAQEEGRNINENCHWGIVRRFKDGKTIVNHNKFVGYTKDKDGNLITIPEEAEVVRRILRLFLEENSSHRIKQTPEADDIRTATGNTVWQATVINKMPVSEKYMGGALLQKIYTVDFLIKKEIMDKGIMPQYYVEDDHRPVIFEELFHRVQEEKTRRASVYRTGTKKKNIEIRRGCSLEYVLSGIMARAECGQPYRRQVWSKYGAERAMWWCDNRPKHGSGKRKHSPILKEEILHEAIMTAVNGVAEDQSEFMQAPREDVIQITGSCSATTESMEYDGQIEELQKKMMKLIEDNTKTESVDEVFDKEYRIIADEVKELKKKKTKVVREKQPVEFHDQGMQGMEGYMRKVNYLKKEFDNDLMRRLLRAVRVISESKIGMQFQLGIVMIQRMDFED